MSSSQQCIPQHGAYAWHYAKLGPESDHANLSLGCTLYCWDALLRAVHFIIGISCCTVVWLYMRQRSQNDTHLLKAVSCNQTCKT